MARLLFPVLLASILLLPGIACGGGDSGNSSTSTATSASSGTVGSWSAELSGAATGTPSGSSSCTESDASHRITLTGTMDSGTVLLTVGSVSAGSFDLSRASSGLAITAAYTPNGGAATEFAGNGGAQGASGAVTIAAGGAGTMQVVIPEKAGGDPLTVSATWTCS